MTNAVLRLWLGLVLTCVGLWAAGEEARYAAQLSGLDPQRPESSCSARDGLRDAVRGASATARAQMFRRFLAFHTLNAAKSGEAFGVVMNPVHERADEILVKAHWKSGSASTVLRNDPVVRKAIGPWLDCGFGVYASEGGFYLGPDIEAVEQFASQLPPDLRAWLKFLHKEGGFEYRVQEDAALTLTWMELGARLYRWESFLAAYPSVADYTRPEVQRLAYFFLFGLDNSPLKEYASGRVDRKVLAAWQRFCGAHPKSRYAETIRKMLAALAGDGNRMSPAVEEARRWVGAEWKD